MTQRRPNREQLNRYSDRTGKVQIPSGHAKKTAQSAGRSRRESTARISREEITRRVDSESVSASRRRVPSERAAASGRLPASERETASSRSHTSERGNTSGKRHASGQATEDLYETGPVRVRRDLSKADTKSRKRKRGGKGKIIGLIIGAVVLLALAFLAFRELFPVYGACKMEIGTNATVSDFLRFPDKNAYFTDNSETYDPNIPGTYHLEIKSGWFAHPCTLTITDSTAPVIEVQDWIVGKNETCEADVFVRSVNDQSETTAEFIKKPDFTLIDQDQEVVFVVKDAFGNSTEGTAKLTILPIVYRVNLEAGTVVPSISDYTGEAESSDNYIISDLTKINYFELGENDIEVFYHGKTYPAKVCIVDMTPPVFDAVEDFTAYIGDPIRYKEHVSVHDNSGTVNLTVDTSKVDPATEGVYEVTYTATDPSGNSSSATLHMTVAQKTIDEIELFDLVDSILAEIITDDMSQYDKALAIFSYIQNHIAWQNDSPKGDYVAAAMFGLQWGAGDCYTYFSLAKVMLTRAGIKNMDIERIPDGNEMHYWNLVDIDDGHGWYHFDSTPFEPYYFGFLLTDEDLANYNFYGQYNYDRNIYPVIP